MMHIAISFENGEIGVMQFFQHDAEDVEIANEIARSAFSSKPVSWVRISADDADKIRASRPKPEPKKRDPSMIGVGVMHDIAPEVADAVNQMAGIIRELSEDRENDKQRIAALEAVIEAIKERALSESGEA